MTVPTGTAVEPGTIVSPARQPPPGKEDTTEPLPFATRLWDVLLAHGATKMGPALIRLAGPHKQTAWKQYQDYHTEWRGKDGDSAVWDPALREYVARALAHGVRRGWLALDDKGFYTAVISDDLPETTGWTPITEMAKSDFDTVITYDYAMPVTWQPAIAEHVYRDNGFTKQDMIRAMKVRAKPDSARMKSLKESLRSVGQIYPIVRWPTNTTKDAEWIVVDGRTREELLLKICEEEAAKAAKGHQFSACEPIKYLDLPASLPATQVLGFKINAEMYGSTKTDESRDDYIAELAKLGMSHDKISEMVRLGRRRVTAIANAAGIVKRSKIDAHKEEILALRYEEGWTERAIAEETGFNSSGIHKALARWEAEAAAEAEESASSRHSSATGSKDADVAADKPDAVTRPTKGTGTDLPKPDTATAKALLTLVKDLKGSGTQRFMYETAGLVQAQVAGSMNTWVKNGWVVPAGKVGTAKNYKVTQELLDLLDANPKWISSVRAKWEPAPEPEPEPELAKVITLVPVPALPADATGDALDAIIELIGIDKTEEILTIMVAHETDALALSDRLDKLKLARTTR